MNAQLPPRIIQLKNQVLAKRKIWYDIRKKLENRKNELFAINYTKSQVRKDRVYKNLFKQKKRIAKEIRHLEQKINRALAKWDKGNNKKN